MAVFVVVQCGGCEAFQVLQEPKSGRFACKMCGEKNSVRRVYGRANKAKEMRLLCQALSRKRASVDEVRAAAAADAAAFDAAVAAAEADSEAGGERDDDEDDDEEGAEAGGFWGQFSSADAAAAADAGGKSRSNVENSDHNHNPEEEDYLELPNGKRVLVRTSVDDAHNKPDQPTSKRRRPKNQSSSSSSSSSKQSSSAPPVGRKQTPSCDERLSGSDGENSAETTPAPATAPSASAWARFA